MYIMFIMVASEHAATRAQPRSDLTRARVMDATVACIVEEGFHASNLTRIADTAGMTTGAIQHQFGDKATLLADVVERGFDRMVERLTRLPGGAHSVAERVSALVRALWAELAPRLEWVELAGEPEYIRSNIIVGLKHLPIRYRLRA